MIKKLIVILGTSLIIIVGSAYAMKANLYKHTIKDLFAHIPVTDISTQLECYTKDNARVILNRNEALQCGTLKNILMTNLYDTAPIPLALSKKNFQIIQPLLKKSVLFPEDEIKKYLPKKINSKQFVNLITNACYLDANKILTACIKAYAVYFIKCIKQRRKKNFKNALLYTMKKLPIELNWMLSYKVLKYTHSIDDIQDCSLTLKEKSVCQILFEPYHLASAAYFYDNNKTIATGCVNGFVYIWSVLTRQCLQKLLNNVDCIVSIQQLKDSNTLVIASNNGIFRLWDPLENIVTTVSYEKLLPNGEIVSSCLSCDGNFTALGYDSGLICIYSTNTIDAIMRVWKAHPYNTDALSFSPNNNYLASSSSVDQKTHIWDWTIQTNKPIKTFQKKILLFFEFYSPHYVMFSPNSKKIAFSGETEKQIKVFTIQKRTTKVLESSENGLASAISFSRSGKILAVGSKNSCIYLWNIKLKQCIKCLEGHSDIICSVCFSPKDTYLFSSSFDSTSRIWNISNAYLLGYLKKLTLDKVNFIFNALQSNKIINLCDHSKSVELYDSLPKFLRRCLVNIKRKQMCNCKRLILFKTFNKINA